MQVFLCRITARRTKEGLVTAKREIIGPCDEDPGGLLDRVAAILAAGCSGRKEVMERSGRRPE